MRLPQPLLSRRLDPVLGIFTGFLAYYLYETHPRTDLPKEQRLMELIRWKWSRWQNERTTRLNSADFTK